MAEFIITRKQKDYLKMPYQVIINGRLAGVMRTPQALMPDLGLNERNKTL